MVLSSGQKKAIGALILLVGGVALLENCLVLSLLACSPALRRRPTFLFMGSLALADAFASVFYTVSFVAFHLFEQKDDQTASLLKLGGVTLAFSGSVGSLLLTAVDRFLCLYRSHSYRAVLTRRRALLALLLLWTSIPLVSFLPLMGWNCSELVSPSCSDLFPYVSLSFLLFWTVAVLLVLLLILAAYALILWKARRHQASMAALRGAVAPQHARMRLDLRLARTLSFILLILVGCWLPVLGFMLADVSTTLNETQKAAFAFCSTLCLVNSAVNPFLYALRCHEIRLALVVRLQGLTRGGGACCRRRAKAPESQPRTESTEMSRTGASSYGRGTPSGSQQELDRRGQEEVTRGGGAGGGEQKEVTRGGGAGGVDRDGA